MSGPDELTPAQLEELRADLVNLEGALADHLGADDDLREGRGSRHPIGRLSRMDALAQQQVAKAGKEATRARLGQVRAALRRMDEGTYGLCLRTEEPIGYARLKVRPEATLSLVRTARARVGAMTCRPAATLR